MKTMLTTSQLQIVNYDSGTVVVKACPGSGKTFSVAARIAQLLNTHSFMSGGIAAMSFTNVACREIEDKLIEKFNLKERLSYPHFLGTIDHFINTYLFLPYGHLIMGCDKRPELVGEPHRSWTKGKGERRYVNANGRRTCVGANPDGYFDCCSFDIDAKLYPTVAAQRFHFSFAKYNNKDGTIFKPIRDVIDSKLTNFQSGFATQADANYISLQVIRKFPLIAQAIAKKFNYLIVDEAQDTDAIQMAIVEILHASGLNNIMLIGDRDQSIYEWNNANPALFDKKFALWDKITLDENWRSAQVICNFNQPLSSFNRSFAVNPAVKYWDVYPSVFGYDINDYSGADQTIMRFCAECEQNKISITKEDVAIVYRGKASSKFLHIESETDEFDKIPWERHHYYVRDIVRGKFLYERGDLRKGYKLIEKGLYELAMKISDINFHCTTSFLSSVVESKGLQAHRSFIFDFLQLLPTTNGKNLDGWIIEANQILSGSAYPYKLHLIMSNAKVPIDGLFGNEIERKHLYPFYYGTIHSVKGRTFDAVLVLLGKRAGAKSNYSNMLSKGPKQGEAEELRTVYVGLTRPRKILYMLVPAADVSIWRKKMG